MGMKVETPKKPKITTESAIVTVCVDLSKSTFHVVGLDAGGNKILRKIQSGRLQGLAGPPGADPHAGWCGRGAAQSPPMPISMFPMEIAQSPGTEAQDFRREPQEFPEEGRKATSGTWLSSCHKSVMHSADPLGQPRNTPITRVGDTHTS